MTGFDWNLFSSAAAEPETTQQQTEPYDAAMPVNPYDVLQVRRDATPFEIRAAYKRLALWHHPGRTHASLEERQRRLQVFEILAACYETLTNPTSRRKFDAYMKDMERAKLTSGLPVGEINIGGKRFMGAYSPARSILSGYDNDDRIPARIPALSRASSHSSSSEFEEDGNHPMELHYPVSSEFSDGRSQRSLVDESTTGSRTEAEVHFTGAETASPFGGPFTHLSRVRNFEPFEDPFLVFEKVFGSKIFKVDQEELGRLKEWMPLRSTRVAGWRGSSRTTPDGNTKVFTTSRVLHDRMLTRTETMTMDMTSGKSFSFVTVTSQDLDEEEDASKPTNSTSCWICCLNTDELALDDDETWSVSLCSTYLGSNFFD